MDWYWFLFTIGITALTFVGILGLAAGLVYFLDKFDLSEGQAMAVIAVVVSVGIATFVGFVV